MAIVLKLTGTLDKADERGMFSEIIAAIGVEMKVKVEDYDTLLKIDVCPEGLIECMYDGCDIEISTTTTKVGPGFHAFVCDVFEAIVKEGTIAFVIHDETNYFCDRDYEKLKYEYFYPWLRMLADYIENSTKDVIYLSWPKDYYLPEEKKGYVITPLGYLRKEDFVTLEIEDLAQQFFIWNAMERDAKYYRNCAYACIWKECYFEYSLMNDNTAKTANTIIDYIEASYVCDATIALPMQIYQDLCKTMHREPFIKQAQEVEVENIGYRRHMIKYPFLNWYIPVLGCCEKSYDRNVQALHFMAPYKSFSDGWEWMIKVSGYKCTTEHPTFLESLVKLDPKEEAFTLETKQFTGKGKILKLYDHNVMFLQFISGNDTLFLDCFIRNEADIKMIKEWCQGIVHQGDENEILRS